MNNINQVEQTLNFLDQIIDLIPGTRITGLSYEDYDHENNQLKIMRAHIKADTPRAQEQLSQLLICKYGATMWNIDNTTILCALIKLENHILKINYTRRHAETNNTPTTAGKEED